jgi:hypothetical protein|tara:strand:- start:358 stop:1050 length:693 start_codon:yes stop_codon:yes gene_type:complete
MICPKCKQKTNHVTNSKFFDEFNYLERERKCRTPNCFNKFITYEQISPDNKKVPILKIPDIKTTTRKTESRTEWQDFRFLFYAGILVVNVFRKAIKYLEKNKLREKFDENIIRIQEIKTDKSGVISYKLEDDISGKVYKFKVRGVKAETVRKVLKNEYYWKKYKEIFKKDVLPEDKDKELRQFPKSIVHKKTGIRSEKYNIEFLKQNPLIQDFVDTVGEEQFWIVWKKLH